MSAKAALGALVLALAACAVPSARPDRLAGVSGADLAAHCAGKEGWSVPAPPARVHGSTWFVGTCGITALLIASPRGHVLIDGATAEAAPHVAANIERLGFKLRDVKAILSSHEHLDHAGGLADLQRRSGAKLYAVAAAKRALESGVVQPDDPQAGLHPPYPGARVDRVLRHGEQVRVGAAILTAHATPGHAPGSTSWTWTSCEAGACRRMAFADSVSAVSGPEYRFADHPEYVAAFRTGLGRIAALGCEILLTPHPSASTMFERIAGRTPLAEDGACAAYAARGRAGLDARLARERGQ